MNSENNTASNGWIYKNHFLNSESDLFRVLSLPETITPKTLPVIGFVYCITERETGKSYIGRKLLTHPKRVKNKKTRVYSDWMNYWSSSPALKLLIEEKGKHSFDREILAFLSSKGSLVYAEELCLFQLGVLESDKFFNNNIRSRIYRSWVKQEEIKELREILKNRQN